MTFSRLLGDAYRPIFIPPPLTFSHLAEIRAVRSRRLASSRREPPLPTRDDRPRALALRTIVGRSFPRLIEAKCEVRNMSNITAVADGQVRSRILVTAQRSVVIGALGAAALLGRALPVEAVALPQHPCTPALEQILAEWDAAGFDNPSKPGQMIVHGRKARVSSGGEVTCMTNQIRQAVWDCQHGNVPAVRERVALVTERLHQRS